jgi:hypothetical protein
VSVSSGFLWRFLEDVWDLLPSEDRNLFESYWSAQLQIASNLEHKTLEAALSTGMSTVPVFLTERWNRFVMDEDSCDLFETTDILPLIMYAPIKLVQSTAFFDTVKVSVASGEIYHEETIRFFDNAVHGLRYGDIVADSVSVSLPGFSTDGTGATVTANDTLTKVGAFVGVETGMILKISAATPGTPIGSYTIRAKTSDDTVVIDGDFGIGAATGVTYEINSKYIEYTANRDYAINIGTGQIQALDGGRIPPTEILNIRYRHTSYVRGLDYELDEPGNAIHRIVGTSIADGQNVAVSYTYNATATLSMDGTQGAVSATSLTDATKDFSTLLPDRTLTIKSGPNAGTYPINAVISPTQILITGTFPAVQSTAVVYSIDAFPHGVKVDKEIVSIPVLRDLVDDPLELLIEDVDFTVSDGILATRAPFRLASIGPEDLRVRQSWAEVTKVDKETPYRNFGVLIDFYRKNSEAYKQALQGLWYTFWTGSTPGNLQRGLHILLGLPFAKKAGRVSRVNTDLGKIDITDPRGQVITYTIPAGLDPVVSLNDELDRFESLTTGIQIIDRNSEPGFVSTRLGRSGINRFLTDNASLGTGDTDETKALTLLENHLFLPQVLTEAITQRVNVTELVGFLENMKPKWGHYVFSFLVEVDEELIFSEELGDIQVTLDLTTTIGGNPINRSAQESNFTVQSAAALPVAPPPPTMTPATHTLVSVQRTNGRIISGGTQAAGNFSAASIDFVDLGIDRGDFVRIDEGIFLGAWEILKRVSASVLSLNIPDGLIVGASNLDFVVFPSERMLDNDAVNVGRENILKLGTDYFSPAGLNTKTDADLAGSSLRNNDVKALLLIDIGIAGAEVQGITDADVENNEFDVGTPPAAPVTRNHEIASAALKRTDNGGPGVTHAFAI